MNKYELALVVSAKVEDEVRDAVVEKAKDTSHVTTALSQKQKNGVRKNQLTKFRKCMKASTISFSLKQTHSARRKLKDTFASWTMY